MLTIYQFTRLKKDVQLNLLHQEGVHLELILSIGNREKVLFWLFWFYVEVEVNPQTGKPTRIVAFRSLRKLERYLPQIDISEIYPLLIS